MLISPRFLVAVLFVASTYLSAQGNDWYVDPQKGDDDALGDQDHPYRTIAQALTQADGVGGTIHLLPDTTYTEPVVISKGGTETNPLVLDGHGALINLGHEVTDGPWTPVGDAYRLEQTVESFKRHYVTSPLFVNGFPLWVPHSEGRGRPAEHGGSVHFDEEGHLVVRFPDGLTPDNATVVLTSSDFISAVHASGGQFVHIKDLTVCFAGNDGFNFHNDCQHFELERVRAVFNGDQGISSHGTSIVAVRESEVAFNGTMSAGVFDIGESQTRYTNVLSHQNRNGGVAFQGEGLHELTGVISFGNPGGDLPKPSTTVQINDSEGGVEILPSTFPDWGTVEQLSDREARFIALRPVAR